MCQAGAVVACWSLTQEVGVQRHLFAKIFSTDSVDSLEFISEKLNLQRYSPSRRKN